MHDLVLSSIVCDILAEVEQLRRGLVGKRFNYPFFLLPVKTLEAFNIEDLEHGVDSRVNYTQRYISEGEFAQGESSPRR